MTEPLGLQIQLLGGFNEQALVLLHAAEAREQGPVTAGQVADLFRALQLPPPRNERQHLVELRKRSFAMQPSAGQWATTHLGAKEIERLMGSGPRAAVLKRQSRPNR